MALSLISALKETQMSLRITSNKECIPCQECWLSSLTKDASHDAGHPASTDRDSKEASQEILIVGQNMLCLIAGIRNPEEKGSPWGWGTPCDMIGLSLHCVGQAQQRWESSRHGGCPQPLEQKVNRHFCFCWLLRSLGPIMLSCCSWLIASLTRSVSLSCSINSLRLLPSLNNWGVCLRRRRRQWGMICASAW